MKKVIWKYAIGPGTVYREIPQGGQILDVQAQQGEPQMWVLVDPKAPVETRHFHVFGTGHPFDDIGLEYIGTFQIAGGSLIFHLFEQTLRDN